MESRPLKTRRLGLTRSGYNGVSLHGKSTNSRTVQREIMDHGDDKDSISAPPLSSSDEEGSSPKRKLPTSSRQSPRPVKKRATASKMNQSTSTATKRTTRRIGDPAVSSQSASTDTEVLDDKEEEFFSLSQQQRRKGRGYGKSNTFEQKATATVTKAPSKQMDGFVNPLSRNHAADDGKQKQEDGFKMPNFGERLQNEPETRPTFRKQSLPPLDGGRPAKVDKGFQQKALKIADPLLRSEVQEAIKAGGEGFKKRDDPFDQVSNPSSSSVDIFQKALFSQQNSPSSPISSLSSAAASSPQHSQPSDTPSRCPLCETLIDRSFFESYNNGRPLKYSDQHRFCHAHKLHSAKSQWSERGYPSIDWTTLTTTRTTPSHISSLLQILYGKKPSHYSTIVSSYASGGPSSLQKYFKEGIIDTVSAGYYGPKGSKLLAQVIQERLSKQLNQSAKRNSLVRNTGVGGYVQAVLVPELTVLLVKEDMGIEGDEEARRVMGESKEIGEVCNGEEEDAIVPAEEEDDDGGGGPEDEYEDL